MTNVICYMEDCAYCREDCVCTKDEITLDSEHLCDGGCDDGWEVKDKAEDTDNA